MQSDSLVRLPDLPRKAGSRTRNDNVGIACFFPRNVINFSDRTLLLTSLFQDSDNFPTTLLGKSSSRNLQVARRFRPAEWNSYDTPQKSEPLIIDSFS